MWILSSLTGKLISAGLIVALAAAWLISHDRAIRQQCEQEHQIALEQLKADAAVVADTQLKAAQIAAQREIDHVQADAKLTADKNAELLRRISAYRMRLATPARPGPLPGPDSDPAHLNPDPTPAELLAGRAFEVAAGCAADYARAARKLEAIGRLTH